MHVEVINEGLKPPLAVTDVTEGHVAVVAQPAPKGTAPMVMVKNKTELRGWPVAYFTSLRAGFPRCLFLLSEPPRCDSCVGPFWIRSPPSHLSRVGLGRVS